MVVPCCSIKRVLPKQFTFDEGSSAAASELSKWLHNASYRAAIGWWQWAGRLWALGWSHSAEGEAILTGDWAAKRGDGGFRWTWDPLELENLETLNRSGYDESEIKHLAILCNFQIQLIRVTWYVVVAYCCIQWHDARAMIGSKGGSVLPGTMAPSYALIATILALSGAEAHMKFS